MTSGFRVKRVYDAPAPQDGLRILVDRLWPRGLSKESARLDGWAKDVTPSAELRSWFHGAGGDPYDEFSARYAAELQGPAQQRALRELRAQAAVATVTLVTAVKDADRSHVTVLLDFLRGRSDP